MTPLRLSTVLAVCLLPSVGPAAADDRAPADLVVLDAHVKRVVPRRCYGTSLWARVDLEGRPR